MKHISGCKSSWRMTDCNACNVAVDMHGDLLEALQEALCWLDPDCKLDGEKYRGEDFHSDKEKMIIQMYQAIAKAEGK